MTEELVDKCVRAMRPKGAANFFPTYGQRAEMVRAIIPIVRADALEEVSRHLSAVQYDPAPYTAMKYRLASLAKG